jgi:hypothetical protein
MVIYSYLPDDTFAESVNFCITVRRMHDQLISELYVCADQCEACYKACLNEKNVDKLKHCIALDQECYEVCMLTGKFLEKGTQNADKYLKHCAEICTACAEECEKHHHGHCQKCAAECRKCAEMCLDHQHHVET